MATNKTQLREAAERVLRCKTEPQLDVYVPLEPGKTYTYLAGRVADELRRADEILLATYAAEQLAGNQLTAAAKRVEEAEENNIGNDILDSSR